MTTIVTGAGGMLGRAVMMALRQRREGVVGLHKNQLDVRNFADVQNYITEDDTVFNCAGVVRDARTRYDVMSMTNALGPQLLAHHAGRLVHVSSDRVFNGREGGYAESSLPSPVDVYGVTKLAGEVAWAPHLTIRCGLVGYGPRGLVSWLLGHPRGAVVRGYDLNAWNGLYVQTAAGIIADLGLSGETGLVHVHAAKPTTKYELLKGIAAFRRPDIKVVRASVHPSRYMTLASDVLPAGHPHLSHTWDEMMGAMEEDTVK